MQPQECSACSRGESMCAVVFKPIPIINLKTPPGGGGQEQKLRLYFSPLLSTADMFTLGCFTHWSCLLVALGLSSSLSSHIPSRLVSAFIIASLRASAPGCMLAQAAINRKAQHR